MERKEIICSAYRMTDFRAGTANIAHTKRHTAFPLRVEQVIMPS